MFGAAVAAAACPVGSSLQRCTCKRQLVEDVRDSLPILPCHECSSCMEQRQNAIIIIIMCSNTSSSCVWVALGWASRCSSHYTDTDCCIRSHDSSSYSTMIAFPQLLKHKWAPATQTQAADIAHFQQHNSATYACRCITRSAMTAFSS